MFRKLLRLRKLLTIRGLDPACRGSILPPVGLRTRRVTQSPLGATPEGGTTWQTGSGGVFVEPVQRPALNTRTVTLTVTLDRNAYKLLEVLHDDVASYLSRLLASHVKGLITSSHINAERKRNASK